LFKIDYNLKLIPVPVKLQIQEGDNLYGNRDINLDFISLQTKN